MGTIYPRGKKLWMGLKDHEGKWVYRRTGYTVGQEKLAEKALLVVESEVRKGKKVQQGGDLTIETYAQAWCDLRIKSPDHWEAKREKQALQNHVFGEWGHLKLAEVRPSHIREILAAIAAKGRAKRTQSNLYALLHRMFGDAAADELIVGSPCVLRRGEKPRRTDKDPAWRATAFYTREEIQLLISDDRIPLDRRVVYGLAFIGALREGEIGALRWRAIDSKCEPLGKIQILASWNRRHKVEKLPKNGRTRDAPIHPALAKLLATWKLGGYFRYMGKPVHADDLVVPTSRGTHRAEQTILRDLKVDLLALGLRHRRFHDSRRSFISLAMADGARKDILRWVTHGPEGDVVDLYTTLPWSSLCEAVACFKIDVLENGLLQSLLQKRSEAL